MTTEQDVIKLQDEIEREVQNIFDARFKPLLIAEMKRLKIKSIENVMGVDFFTMNSGKVYSDTEFCESSDVRRKFHDLFISTWQHHHWYSLINLDAKQ